MTKASENLFPGIIIRESANDGSDFSNPSADYRRLFLGEDGELHVKDSAGTVTGIPGGGAGTGQGLVDFATAKRTSGNLTLNNTSWTNVDTGLDLVLTAASGDYIEYGVSGHVAATGAVALALDVATIVSASPVNYLSGGGGSSDYGVAAWLSISSVAASPSGSLLYLTVSGDISGGTVTLRLRYRTDGATNKTLNATTAVPLHVWAKNIGPAL